MKPLERRLGQIVAALAALRPKPKAPLPGGMEWAAYVPGAELDACEQLFALLEAEGREMTEGEARAYRAIHVAATGRMAAGWPDHCADYARYDAADQSLGQALRDALPLAQSLHNML